MLPITHFPILCRKGKVKIRLKTDAVSRRLHVLYLIIYGCNAAKNQHELPFGQE
jgi:hypothetical protein